MDLMRENYSEEDTYLAADVILKIIKNEVTIADDWEYPSEFQPAYLKLMEFDIVRIRESEFIPGANFQSACNLGIGKFIERREQQPQVRKSAFKILIGGILGTTNYLWSERRKKQPS